MATKQYANGTMNVKDADGMLVPFYPRTKTTLITKENANSVETLETTLNNTATNIDDIPYNGHVKVCASEPTEDFIQEIMQNTQNETLLAIYDSEVANSIFKYIVVTSNLSANNLETGIPFSLPSGNAYYLVDWGDGTTSKITRKSTINDLAHAYAQGGTYTVQVYCNNWTKANVYMTSGYMVYADSNFESRAPYRYKCNHTLERVLTPFPKIGGTEDVPRGLFAGSSLKYVPSNIFINYPDAITFNGTFLRSELQELPQRLFYNNRKTQNFIYTFYSCPFTVIPDLLFKYNTEVTSFEECFEYSQCSRCNIYITSEKVGYNGQASSNAGMIFTNGRHVANSYTYAYALENSLTYESLLAARRSLPNGGYGHFYVRTYTIDQLPEE